MELLMAAGSAVLVVCGLAVVLSRRIPLAISLTAAAAALHATGADPGLELGGVRTTPPDLLAATLIVAGCLRWVRPGHDRSPARGYAVATALLLVGLARGVTELGLQDALNEGRLSLYFVAPLFFFSTVRSEVDVLAHLQRSLRYVSLFLFATALHFIYRNGLDSYSPVIVDGNYVNRPLTANGAMLMGFFALISFLAPSRGRYLGHVYGALVLLLVIVSNQRTVWVATALAIGMAMLFSRTRLQSGPRHRVTGVAGLGAVAATILYIFGPSSIRYAASSAELSEGTFAWRVEGWRSLVDARLAGPGLDQLIGQPAGAGFARVINDAVVEVEPHNGYITALLVVGVLGAAALVWTFMSTLRGLLAIARTHRDPGALAAAVLVFSSMIYMVSYTGDEGAGLVLGLAAGHLAVHRDRARDGRGGQNDLAGSSEAMPPRWATSVSG